MPTDSFVREANTIAIYTADRVEGSANSNVAPASNKYSYEVMVMFKKKPEKKSYDKENQKAILRCSICTGEQVAGFKDLNTGHFEEIMLIKNSKDLDEFMEMYGVTAITKEY